MKGYSQYPRALVFSIASYSIFFVIAAAQETPPTDRKKSNDITIAIGEPRKLKADPTVVEIIDSTKGDFAYTSFLKKSPYSSFLVTSQNITKETNLIENIGTLQLITYRLIKPATEVFNHKVLTQPIYSPDGRYILFRCGSGYLFPQSQLYVLDVLTQEIKKVAHQDPLNDSNVSWSPDGNFIAYIMGGDNTGSPYFQETYVGPRTLWIIDWRNGKEYEVATSDTLRGPFSWIAAHNLIYSFLSSEGETRIRKKWQLQSVTPPTQLKETTVVVPDIDKIVLQPSTFEFSIEKKKSVRLIDDAYRPVASSDGQWVAFYGSEDIKKPIQLRAGWEDFPRGAALCVAKHDGTERFALDLVTSYSPIVWLPDNRHFLTLQKLGYGWNARGEIKEWDVQTRHFRNVAVLQSNKNETGNASSKTPNFAFLRVSQDGKTLFALMSEVSGVTSTGGWLIFKRSVRAVDIQTGDVKIVAQITGDSGLDWSDVSLSKREAEVHEP